MDLATHCACNPDDPICLTLWKADGASDSERIIEGLASVDIRDTEGEIVHPDQLDFSYLDKGKAKVNWAHRGDPGDQLGTVVAYKVGLVKNIVPKKFHERVKGLLNHVGLWVRARLKTGLRKAEDVWTDMTSNPDDHGLGFSLQGTAKRDGTDVVGGLVTNVALTPNPVLAETFAVLSKALGVSYARQDQTGIAAATREDLRDEVISTSIGNSKYGRNPPGGFAFQADAVVGHRTGRDRETGAPISHETKQSFAMPAGVPVQQPFDTTAAVRALKSFQKHVRSLGAERGNVLDGSETYFELMHGLDHTTARALAKYVRQNADKLFRKCFPPIGIDDTEEKTMPQMTAIDELEKAIKSLDEGGEPTPAPTGSGAEDTMIVPPVENTDLNKGKPAEEPAAEPEDEPEPAAAETPGECSNCGYDHLSKGCTTCPQCGGSLQKSHVAEPTGDEQLVDVTNLLKSIDGGLKSSDRASNVLAKSVLHVVQANINLSKLVEAQGVALARANEEISNLRKESCDRTDTLIKSIDGICERLGVISATPRPQKSAGTIEKSKTAAPDAAATEEVDLKYQGFLMNGAVKPDVSSLVRQGALTKAFVVQQLEKNLPVGSNGRF